MAFRRTLGTIGTTVMLAFTAVGGLCPVANAAEPVVTVAGQQLSIKPATSAADSPKATDSVVGVSKNSGAKPLDLNCWNYAFDGPWFYETCNGSSYRVFVDCSDGYRYISTAYFSGQHNFALECPAGDAVGGGAIGN
ncbi:hypothetical protein ACFRAR_02365 [Kitasatospora sp. NPDC056651]|uniref:hypothetical protein n=1 Tax=Kitasatospora sp. NPDC056651 TaxID=3345892 RepID=UPI0036BCC75C